MKDIKDTLSDNYGGGKLNPRRIYMEYESNVVFAIVLLACVQLSYWLADFIPDELFRNGISQILNGCIATVGLFGACLVWRHHDGMRARKLWAFVLLFWTVLATLLLMRLIAYDAQRSETGILSLKGWELVIGNFYAWLLLIYPAEMLRPGWLNVRRSVLHLLPVFIVGVVDYLLPVDLRLVLAFYPVVLVGFLTMHIRAYRTWCEENYSSMDNIDQQWIVKYLTMYLTIGGSYIVMSFKASTPRMFTTLWLLLFMLAYSTEQIVFRPDPWKMVRRKKVIPVEPEEEPQTEEELDPSIEENRAILEEWMNKEKPYRDPEFRLMDLHQVLPMNRTYLSRFINAAYGCNFYQFVTNYRIAEAKRLIRKNPDMQIQDIAEQCGFSSPTMFGRVFVRETGLTPGEYAVQGDNAETQNA